MLCLCGHVNEVCVQSVSIVMSPMRVNVVEVCQYGNVTKLCWRGRIIEV